MAREVCEEKSRNFCYSSAQNHLVNQIQQGGFDSNQEIFNLTTGMEMIGFSKNNPAAGGEWKELFNKETRSCSNSISKTNMNESTSDFYDQHEFQKPDDHHQFTSSAAGMSEWQVDDSSLRSCVFSCEGNERPSQGLSLSLSSANPSGIGLQCFELIRQTSHGGHDNHHQQDIGFFGKPSNVHQQQQMIQDGFQLGKAGGQFQVLRSSKYLGPAQELLNEFCCLGTKQIHDHDAPSSKQKMKNKQYWADDIDGASSSSRNKQSLYSLDFIELQKRKTKLLSMLEEVDRRYRHYCDQMKAVVSSFEAVAGIGAASVYSALASKAMSRHFRCLRDGIVSQIQATRKAMGEKDPVAPGTTKGETPRLRVLDQTLRQQRAFQQMSMMESHPWRPQRGLPERSVSVLRAWLFEHFLHPYPSDVDKHILARQTGLSRSQVSNWFINARVRLWKPMVEEMYVEETKEHENNMASPDIGGGTDGDDNIPLSTDDQKPTQDQLVRVDSECLSSIITNPDHKNDISKSATKALQNHHLHHHQQQQQQQQQNFGTYAGAMELDFSSYSHHAAAAAAAAASGGVSYGGDHHNANINQQSFNGGVSLTLGLQQHAGGSGVSLAFSPASQSSLFFARDHIEDCQPVQYSLLDGDQGQHLPYRNLMGAQLLHDLAG